MWMEKNLNISTYFLFADILWILHVSYLYTADFGV